MTSQLEKNKLSATVKEMCKMAQIEGRKNNQILRSSAVSSLYKSNVPEKIIQDRSGHQSLLVLHAYEKTNSRANIASKLDQQPPRLEQQGQMVY